MTDPKTLDEIAAENPMPFWVKDSNGNVYEVIAKRRNFILYYNDVAFASKSDETFALIDKPKRMVTKKIEAWANVYPDGGVYIHAIESNARMVAKDSIDKAITVKLTGSCEIEE